MLAFVLLALVSADLAASSRVSVIREDLGNGMVAALTPDGSVTLEAIPLKSEGLFAFSRRLCDTDAASDRIAQANGGTEILKAGLRYAVPFELLRPELRAAALQALFEQDRAVPGGWLHTARRLGETGRVSLWHVARWFTGNGQNFIALRSTNGLLDSELDPGAQVLIPQDLLDPALRALVPPAAPELVAELMARLQGGRAGPSRSGEVGGGPVGERSGRESSAPPRIVVVADTDNAGAAVGADAADSGTVRAVDRSLSGAGDGSRPPIPLPAPDVPLDYGTDAKGPYALYRLRAGEALYSSVVVRFTGRVLAEDVNALADDIARRSGIADVSDIPVDYGVKIPLDLLLPEYLPLNDPRRQEYEAARQASAGFGNQVQARGLAGITVILDAGHGGKDPGASFDGIWESSYVYDISLRVEHLLKEHTAARVLPLVRDGDRMVPENRDVLSYSQAGKVLTNPPYRIETARIGTNLRWYLTNSLFNKERRQGVDEGKVVFLSLHADSLHPSLRGAMVYIPDANLRKGIYGKSGTVYASRKEVREQPKVSFSWKDRVRSEGLSRDLAEHLITAFADHGLPVHDFKPIREKIIQRRSQYVPAVLRYNAVPAKILLEVCNLANAQDRKLLKTRAYRQKVAEAIVQGLLAYYGYPDQDLPVPRVIAEASR